MSKTYITFGVDVSAYATIEAPANTQLDEGLLIELADKAKTERRVHGQDVVFEPQWETEGQMRVVLVTNDQGQTLYENEPLEPQFMEAGQILSQWLQGRLSFKQLVDAAVALKVADPEAIRPQFPSN